MTLNALYNGDKIAINPDGSPITPLSYWIQSDLEKIALAPREEVLDPEPQPEPQIPRWTAFNTAMLSDSNWQAWALPADLRNAMIAASINSNLTSLENAYAIAKAAVPPSAEAITGWQGLADTNNIPIVF